ncbi:proliferation marker protein Ki-67 [Candoia aspera]|uniref:proliferation marker protein Ki-67 n=1 Tax=Candoia aspera TaxID=51853 RepID=UPI002FD7BE86
MPLFGKIVVIKRNGTDGTHFPLTANSCLFGRKKECDIRIQMPRVSKEHCKIEVNENKEAVLFNLSSTIPTQLNGNHFQDPTHLNHGDVLTIIDRSFRFEYPPHSFPQKRLSRSQEKETLQILHVQHVQQVELLHPQNSDYKISPLTGKKLESHPLSSNEKKTQENYSTPEFKYKMQDTEKTNEMSPFSKLYELVKDEGGVDNVKEDTGNETLLEGVFHSTSRTSATSRAKLAKAELSEDSTLQENGGIVANPVPILFEEKDSEKSSSIQSCGIKEKQAPEGTNQSDFKYMEDNEVGKSQIIKSANKYAHFKANQSAQHFPESCCIVSLDYTEKARCLNKINLTDAFTPVESILPKPKSSRKSTQSCSSPCSRNSRRSSKSRRSWVEIDSLNKMKSSGVTEGCSVQVSTEQPESDILIENIYSKTNENRELATETTQNLKDSEDGNSSIVFSLLHFNTSKNCNNSIELNKNISTEYSCIEAIDREESLILPADPSQTNGIMANQIPEKNLGTGCPTNENKIKITTEGHEQNINMKNNIPAFSSSFESNVQTSAKDDAVFEMNFSCPLKVIKKSEPKKSPQKRKGTELDLLVQPLGKRKRVSFGGQLSPELFDKRLPPNSPLKKGAIPGRLSMPFGNSPQAVLKKASELRRSVIKGSFERKQRESIVPKQTASHSVPQRQECFSVPHVASLSSEDEEAAAQEMHVNRLFTEVKKTECDNPESKATILLRRKSCTPRRNSILGKSRAVDAIRSKRRSGASEANLIVAKTWAEVVKQGVPKLQLKSASKQTFKRRSVRKVPLKSSKNTNLLKTPKRKISGHFTTGHANSPAPIVIGKAHTGIVNITAQVPKVVVNYPLKQHSDFSESFTGLAEMFHTPPNGKQNSFVLETQTSGPEMNASEESEKRSALNFNNSSQERHNQDLTSPVLEEVSQISIADDVLLQKSIRKGLSVNERNIMGMEEENLQQESEPDKVRLGVKRVLRTPKQKSEPVEALSEVKRLFTSPKQNSELVEALSGVKRLLRTPKQKLEPVEALSGVKRLLKTPKQKSEPVEALSGVKRLLRTPKQKSEPVEVLSGVKRLLRTPKQKSEPVEALSGVKRLFRTPKQKSEPVEALLGIKRLLKTPKQKSESVEALSGVKRLLRTPRRKSEPVEVLSGIKTLLKTPKQNIESLVYDIYTKSMVSTEEVLKNMIGSVTKKKTKQRIQPMEDININNITEEFKETVKPIKDRESIQLMAPKQRFEPMNNMVGISQTLKTSELKSLPTDDYLGLQKFMTEPKDSSLSPETDYTGVKEMLDTENEHKAELPESLKLMEENGSYITSGNELDSMENVSGSCKAKLEVTFERESHFPVTKNNSSSVPNHVGHVACNSFNELKTEFNEETTRTISLSESYKPDGMSSKNEAKTDFVKEAAANPDALDSEKLEPPALGRTRRRKINDCSSAVYAKKIQRPTKNTHRTRSANGVQTSESFDILTELNPVCKSESNFTAIETKTKQSQRRRPKKLPVKTNGNIGSDNISHTQELEKPSKETTVEKQPVNRRKVATRRNGKTEASMGLEENGPTQENEGDLTAKTWLRSRNVKKSASDLKTKLAKDKTAHAMSGEESIKRNRRGKIAAIQSNPETLLTAFNERKQGRQKVQYKSRIPQMETSENNLTTMKENLVRKGKGKKVHFLLKNDFKVSEEKCALGYEDNAHEEKDSAFLESSVFPKENTSQSCKRKAVPVKTQVSCGSYFKDKCTLENCKDSRKQVSFENVTPTECLPAFNSSFVQEKSMMEIQAENISNGIPKVPLESMQAPTEHNRRRREKLARENQSGRGRGKKAIFSPSEESDSKLASDVKEHNMIVTLKENQPKRGRGRKIVQVLPKPSPLENTAFGEEDSTMNSFPFAQGGCSLPQIQNENVEETEKMPVENVQILEKHIPPKRVVKDNPPRRNRSKQVNETSSNEAADVQDPNMFISQDDNMSKRGRGKRGAPESSSLKSQGAVKENPPRRGRHKRTMSGEISADDGSTQTTAIKGQNIVGKNACPAKGNQPRMSGRRKITLVFQKTLSPIENDTVHLLSSNEGRHSAGQPNEGLKTANNADGNFSRKYRQRKADDEISASSVSSSKSSKLIDNNIQENRMKDLQGVAQQNISRRSKRKQLTPCGTSTESNDELRINDRKTEPGTDKADPLENSFEKKHQSTIASLVSPSLKVSITLSPLSSANENQSGNCKRSVGKGKLAKRSDTYNIMTRSVRGKCMVPKEEFFHENQNRDLEKTATASKNNQRKGRRKVKELEAAVSPSLKEKIILSADSDIVPDDQIRILNNVSNKKVSLMGKGQKFLKIKTMTQNTNQSNSSNYDQNKNVEHSSMLVQKSSSKWGKRKQIKSNSETNATANTMKNVFPENKSTTSKTENTESITVQTRGKKRMKEENTTLVAELLGETEGRTRASKRRRK